MKKKKRICSVACRDRVSRCVCSMCVRVYVCTWRAHRDTISQEALEASKDLACDCDAQHDGGQALLSQYDVRGGASCLRSTGDRDTNCRDKVSA